MTTGTSPFTSNFPMSGTSPGDSNFPMPDTGTSGGFDLGTTGFDLLNPTQFPWSQSTSRSGTSSQQSSNSYSGLGKNTTGQLVGMLMPELETSLSGFAGLPQQYSQDAAGLYKTLMRMGLDEAMPATLQNMVSRGITGGDVMSDALSGAAASVIPNISLMGYQSGMDAANMAQNIPGILGQLMQLANYTKSSSEGKSSGTSTSSSYQEDRSVPQGQLYDFLSGLNLSTV